MEAGAYAVNAPSRIKPKKCRVCPNEFIPWSSTQIVCGYECAKAWADGQALNAEKARVKQERRETREKKEALKSRSQWLKEAQVEFNKYIRLRDKNSPCISCGRFHAGQYHAGHYRTVGSAPELRFCELNVHKQCAPCNNHLSGNLVLYRKALVEKIGMEALEWLEGKHEPLKLTIPEIIAIRDKYRLLCKALTKGE